MNSSIVHGNDCSLIHKKRHLNCYNSDIKYHVTLNTISSEEHAVEKTAYFIFYSNMLPFATLFLSSLVQVCFYL